MPGKIAIAPSFLHDLEMPNRDYCHKWLLDVYTPEEVVAYGWWIYDVDDPIDIIDFGHNNSDHYPEHDVQCENTCDDWRQALIYISDGSVEFDMYLEQGRSNVMLLDLFDNVACRHMDIFLNGDHADHIKGFGKRGEWFSYPVNIPEKYLEKEVVRVKLVHSMDQCMGWDISRALMVSVPLT